MSFNTILLVLSLLFVFSINLQAMITYNVVELGANPDGRIDSTFAFESAWKAACSSSQPARIFVPQGTFLLHKIQFNGPCKNDAILIEIIGSIIAPDHRVMRNVDGWIKFEKVNGVSIYGGILDGNGKSLWDCKNSDKNCPHGATTLTFDKSANITIKELISRDSKLFHIVINHSQDVTLAKVTISAPRNSPNTDGIHVQQSTNVKILHSSISTGDDCISVGRGTSHLKIESVDCGPGHGISIGSLGKNMEEEGVHNITVETVSFRNTQNGVRIKTWGRPCTSFVRDVIFQHATMDNVKNPILIDQNYCPHHHGCAGQDSGVTISDITYRDIHGTSASKVAVKFECSKKNPCHRLTLEDINLTFENQPAEAWCANAAGKASGFVSLGNCFWN